jgi:hypothetical protein
MRLLSAAASVLQKNRSGFFENSHAILLSLTSVRVDDDFNDVKI